VRADKARVDSGYADGRDLQVTTGRQHTRIDLAIEHHRRYVEGLAIGNATAIDERCVHAKRRRQLSRLPAATVNQYDADPHLVQDADLFHEFPRFRRVGKNLAAGFEDEHLAFEQAYVGRCVLERRYDNRAIFPGCHDELPSI
jgi:hypothetical protein